MNKKTGLDYFSLDIDFFQDPKIQFVSARFGTKGEAITIRLLCKIYRQGYYANWNDDIALLFAKSVGDGCQHSCVKDVVYELLKRGFFNRSIFERFAILTSRGIQRRYFDASTRRKKVEYVEEYLLIDISEYTNVVPLKQNVSIPVQNANIMNQNDDILPQSKVKESKVKEKKKGELSLALASFRERYKPEQLKIIDEFFDILKHTRSSAKLADSVILKCYSDWAKYEASKVTYGLHRYIHAPSLHDKKENYVLGIIRNAKASEIEKYKEDLAHGINSSRSPTAGFSAQGNAYGRDETSAEFDAAILKQNSRWEDG